jgi:hypothetical protein
MIHPEVEFFHAVGFRFYKKATKNYNFSCSPVILDKFTKILQFIKSWRSQSWQTAGKTK